jgi:hypothetical protein
MEEMRNAYKMLVGKCKGKRTLGRSRRRSEENIRIDLRIIRVGKCGQDALWLRIVAGTCEHCN